jgi:hypothetical protein
MLTPQEVAAILRVPLKTARQWMRLMPHYRLNNKHLRVTEQALTQWRTKWEERCGPNLETSDSIGVAKSSGAESLDPTGRSSDGPPDALTKRRRARGRTSSSDELPIRATQPRQRRPSSAA